MGFENQALLEHVPHLRRFAISLMRDREQAEDLVQDCLVRALSRRSSFEAGTNLRSWLLTILHNLFIDGRRRRGGQITGGAADHAIDRAKVEPRQNDRLQLIELAAAIAELPSVQRYVLFLVTIEGHSYQEAATIVGIPVGTVRSRLSRARDALRERLEPEPSNEAVEANARA